MKHRQVGSLVLTKRLKIKKDIFWDLGINDSFTSVDYNNEPNINLLNLFNQARTKSVAQMQR